MKALISAFDRHAGAIQALAAILAVLIAIGALIGIKVQIQASERIQQEQSARDIYREYLNISIGRPEFSKPDYCAIAGTSKAAAYENYVEYLLYTAEQAMTADPEWEPVFQAELQNHADYVCRVENWSGYSEDVRNFLGRFNAANCAKRIKCAATGQY